MSLQKLLGVALVVLGLLALVYEGFSYTTRETVFEAGPIEATTERERTVPIPPIAGVVAVIGGIVLLVAGTRKSA